MTLRSIVTLALLWVLQLPAFAAIGTIDSLEGEVRVISATADHAAQAGLELNEGDTVKTGANAWTLLAMSDGATLTLRPNSQLRLDTYRYDPDGDAPRNRSLLALAKGAFRSITGYIGRTNRAGYSIATPTATIGIRGTDHEPAYYPPGAADRDAHPPGTYDKVNDGGSFIRNPKGEVSVKPGQYAFVHHNARFAPQLLKRPPAFYQRHAEFDKKAAARRQDFHRKFEEQHQRKLQEIRQKQGSRKQDLQKPRPDEKQPARDHGKSGRLQLPAKEEAQQLQRREQLEKRAQERQVPQDQRRDLLEKKQLERAALQEQMRQRQQEVAQQQAQRRARQAEEQKRPQQERSRKKEPERPHNLKQKQHEEEKARNP
jgi:hypothetical protein